MKPKRKAAGSRRVPTGLAHDLPAGFEVASKPSKKPRTKVKAKASKAVPLKSNKVTANKAKRETRKGR